MWKFKWRSFSRFFCPQFFPSPAGTQGILPGDVKNNSETAPFWFLFLSFQRSGDYDQYFLWNWSFAKELRAHGGKKHWQSWIFMIFQTTVSHQKWDMLSAEYSWYSKQLWAIRSEIHCRQIINDIPNNCEPSDASYIIGRMFLIYVPGKQFLY